MGRRYHYTSREAHEESARNAQADVEKAKEEAAKNKQPKTAYEIIKEFANIPISKEDFMSDRPLLQNDADQLIDFLLMAGSIAGCIIAAVHTKDMRPLLGVVPAMGIFSVDSIYKEADFSEKQNEISFSPSTNVRFVINRLVELGVITAKAAAKLAVQVVETFKNAGKEKDLEPELAR